jgi:hypothetical protein
MLAEAEHFMRETGKLVSFTGRHEHAACTTAGNIDR